MEDNKVKVLCSCSDAMEGSAALSRTAVNDSYVLAVSVYFNSQV